MRSIIVDLSHSGDRQIIRAFSLLRLDEIQQKLPMNDSRRFEDVLNYTGAEFAVAKYLNVFPNLNLLYDGGTDLIYGDYLIDVKLCTTGKNLAVGRPKAHIIYCLVDKSFPEYEIVGFATGFKVLERGLDCGGYRVLSRGELASLDEVITAKNSIID